MNPRVYRVKNPNQPELRTSPVGQLQIDMVGRVYWVKDGNYCLKGFPNEWDAREFIEVVTNYKNYLQQMGDQAK